MKIYRVNRFHVAHGTGPGSSLFWAQAEIASVDCFPWYRSGPKWKAEARVLYDESRLYWRISTTGDQAIVGRYTRLNDPVCRDSCAEFFLQPSQQPGGAYLNFEINCLGTMLLSYGHGRHDRAHVHPDSASLVTIWHSVPGPTKSESPDDDAWYIEAAIPLDVLARMGRTTAPGPGTVWRGNFYRCADDSSNPQWSCWSPIDTELPDFHRPEFFGELRFQ